MVEYDDWEGEFPLPENIFKWDVDMIRWLAKKFQVDADNQSADPSGDNQHEIMEIPFQMWGYTGYDIGSSYAQVYPSATAFSVYQCYIDGGNSNFITNFVDVFFADRNYSGITSTNYERFKEYCQNISLEFPPTNTTNYYYYHFNYPETRHLYYGNSQSGTNSLYTYDDNHDFIYNCFSNALAQHNIEYGYDSITTGSYLSIQFTALDHSGDVNGYPVFNEWFRTSAYNDTLSGRYAYIPIAKDLPLFAMGMENGTYETQYTNMITNVYEYDNRQTSTYTTEEGDTITIYQGDNNFYIDNDGHGLTYDDLFNVFNDTILPFINVNQGTDITFPSYDDIKYTDMGSFYITPIKDIPALPVAPDIADTTVDVSDFVSVLGGSVTAFLDLFDSIGLSLMLVFSFLACVVIRNLRGS